MSNKTASAPLLDTSVAIAPQESQSLELVQMFDRWVSDPNASVEKVERLMALMERNEAKKAEAVFNRAMSAAQKAMRPVSADAYNPQTKSRYASYEALDRALRPIYTDHGFGLSFNTGDCPLPDYVRVTCKVTHVGGHAEPYHIDMPADGKGAKGGDVMTKTHATGSALSYGQRYLLKMIFNVAVGEDDDDGNKAGAKSADVEMPKGYQDWLDDLQAAADDGWKPFKEAWNGTPEAAKQVEAFRNHLARTNPKMSEQLKIRAQKAGKS
jgi:hypothetical protein